MNLGECISFHRYKPEMISPWFSLDLIKDGSSVLVKNNKPCPNIHLAYSSLNCCIKNLDCIFISYLCALHVHYRNQLVRALFLLYRNNRNESYCCNMFCCVFYAKLRPTAMNSSKVSRVIVIPLSCFVIYSNIQQEAFSDFHVLVLFIFISPEKARYKGWNEFQNDKSAVPYIVGWGTRKGNVYEAETFVIIDDVRLL